MSSPTPAQRIHELEELLKVIARAKYEWESTFDAVTLPVQIVSGDYTIERANMAVAAVGHEHIKKIPGRHCYEAFAGLDRPCQGCPLAMALTGNRTVTTQLTDHVRGKIFEATAYPYAEGRVIMSYRDITEELRLKQEVIQQEKMAAIGMLAGGVAHEINNPLGGILAFTQLLLRDTESHPTLAADLEEIRRAAERCKRIVADLLDFSRVSKEGDRRPVDLTELIEKVLPFLNGEMKSLNVQFRLITHGQVPLVSGQADRLQQVILNLMTNACHAMPRGGGLTLEILATPSGGACLKVHDTGSGIAPEHLQRIFDPFFTTKEPGKGTGLGLSISYRIVKEHGGTIEVQSHEGKGTTFTISFPSP